MSTPSKPQTLEEAFDFTTPIIYEWEVKRLRAAISSYDYVDSGHAENKAVELDVETEEFRRVVLNGKEKPPKDLPLTEREKIFLRSKRDRKPGINFEGSMSDGRRIRVKVGWWYGRYTIITAHEL